ncbi:MAG: Gfo/Idh/MocA family oxidoreductase [Blastochloris sp.]|nr:Gfo/Idh/MocA family oxidoreductase [Blastochloris sp.]
MKPLRIGLIGYKFMGRTHSNAWRQAGHFFDLPYQPELHTLCGRDLQGVQTAAEQLGWAHTETDWRKVVENPEIDVVDISTANDTHAEIALAAAKQGKAILCEKPLALNLKEAKVMRDAVLKSGVVNMVCHNYRRIPAMAQARRMIERGDLGKIYHYRARYLQDWIVDPSFPLVWRLQGKLAGSGTHGDINAHIIDLGRYLIGEIDEVCGLMETFIKQRPLTGAEAGRMSKAAKGKKRSQPMGEVTVDDAVLAIGRFQNGALLNLEASRFALGRKNGIQIEINGSQGSLLFDFEDMNRLKFFNNRDASDAQGFRDILVTESVHPYAGQWWPPGHIIGYEHTFVHTIVDFIHAFKKGQSVQPTFEDGYRNQCVLDAIETSSRRRSWVKVKI